MKKSKLLFSLLLISVSVNAFVLLSGFEPQSPCPEIATYASGVQISNTDAARCIDAYKASVDKDVVTGGIIAGQAIKQAFCAPGSNGLSYYLAQDPENTIANGGVFIVINGVNVVTDGSGTITSVTQTGNKLFSPNSWCPTNCVVLERE